MITIEWLAASVTRQRDNLVQLQVQKLQCQQALQALRQAYLAQPNLVDTNNPIFQQYNTIIDGLNVKIAGEAQNVSNYLFTLINKYFLAWAEPTTVNTDAGPAPPTRRSAAASGSAWLTFEHARADQCTIGTDLNK